MFIEIPIIRIFKEVGVPITTYPSSSETLKSAVSDPKKCFPDPDLTSQIIPDADPGHN